MAAMSNPCLPTVSGVAGVSISSGCNRTSTLRFQVKSGYSIISSLGELFIGDGITSRVAVPPRTVRLGIAQQQSTSTSGRYLGTLGQTNKVRGGSRLKALVDESRSTFKEEKRYALDLQEDEELLKKKAEQLVQQLEGSCIYLIGMMGSGKTTVGRGLGSALGYFFFDSDRLVEEAAGGVTVAQMFQAGLEEDFRNAETDVLGQLSAMSRLVVATGGGVVLRPQNWAYMRHGVTCWLDVPVEILARRVVAVGCHSRPLLGVHTEETAYKQVLERLTRIHGERLAMYKNADCVVSVEGIAKERGVDIEAITPTLIAVQVLEEIIRFLNGDVTFDGQ